MLESARDGGNVEMEERIENWFHPSGSLEKDVKSMDFMACLDK